MRAQYGVRMYSPEFKEMLWDEFASLLAGLGGDTPLGNLVQIRSENDPNMLKHFSPAQLRIREQWRRNHSQINTSESDHMQFLAQIQSYFASQGGG